MIKLQIGNSYLRRNGTKCKIVSQSVTGKFVSASGLYYTELGKCCSDKYLLNIIEDLGVE